MSPNRNPDSVLYLFIHFGLLYGGYLVLGGLSSPIIQISCSFRRTIYVIFPYIYVIFPYISIYFHIFHIFQVFHIFPYQIWVNSLHLTRASSTSQFHNSRTSTFRLGDSIFAYIFIADVLLRILVPGTRKSDGLVHGKSEKTDDDRG